MGSIFVHIPHSILYDVQMLRIEHAWNALIHLDDRDGCFISQLLFFVSLGLWLFTRIILGLTTFATYLKPTLDIASLRIVCLSLLLARELLFGKWDRETLLGFAILLFMAVMANDAGFAIVVDTICYIFVGRNIEFRAIARFCFVVLTAFLLVTTICSLVGLIPETVMSSRSRHHLGFAHPNLPAAFLFFSACLWVFLRNEKFGIADLVAYLVAFAVMFALTHSRTSCALGVILVMIAFVLKYVPDGFLRSLPLTVIEIGSTVICASITIILSALYRQANPWMATLNAALSGRISLAHKAIWEYGIAPFGRQLNFTDSRKYDLTIGQWSSSSNGGIVVDCSYIRILVGCGVLFLLIALVLCLITSWKARINEEWHLLLVIGLISIHGMSEICCAYISYNAFLFLIGSLFCYKGLDSLKSHCTATKHRYKRLCANSDSASATPSGNTSA